MANWTDDQLKSFVLLTDNQDMTAINDAVMGTQPNNPTAQALKDSWIAWWDSLGWLAKNVGTGAYDEARNRRNAFFMANASPEQQAAVKAVQTGGLTTETLQGGTARVNSSGRFPSPAPPPLIPTSYKVVGGSIFAGITTLAILKKLRIL